MSPKRNNGKGSKAPSSVSPIKFNAGGSKQSSQSSKKQKNDNDAEADTSSSQKNEIASTNSNVTRTKRSGTGKGITAITSSAVKEEEVNDAPTATTSNGSHPAYKRNNHHSPSNTGLQPSVPSYLHKHHHHHPSSGFSENMSPKRNNGKGSKAPSSVSPIKFNAGGSKQSSRSNKKQHDNDAVADASLQENEIASTNSNVTRSASSGKETTITSSAAKEQEVNGAPTANIQWITTGLQKKQSPFTLKHWIATVLTLDGRDKFTKIMQYSCRLLGWYFAGLATAAAAARTNTIGATTPASGGGGGSQIMLYQALSTRFTSLYKSLVTSRKAFRMGRSVIEWDKIRSMGWGEYLGYWIRHPLEEGVAGNGEKEDGEGGDCHLLGRLETHPIPEEEDEDAAALEAEDEDDDKNWNGEETASTTVEEKKDDSEKNKKVISRPGRPILPSRMSSNIGWGPSTTTTTIAAEEDASETHHHRPPPLPRTVSEMGRQMYRPYPTQSSTSFGSYQQLKGTSSTLAKQTPPSSTTPAWKLIGGTLKLFGLMGFWAFDNLSFLTSSGFLDPISTTTTTTHDDTAAIRTKRKQRASEYAARCYFMGCLAGLYVNLRSFWIHGNGPLVEARRRYESVITTSSDGKEGDESGNAQHALKKTEQKHFELFLALLKSLCDVTVFSNNPGIDLHLKLRGKKNHEGFHCLCGLISAGTVLYNNFPNAE
eukprot:CAMPEP_0201739892 /NCGR_PEP_ID=MMETSP0593-20130828/46018_1 /ASSEMBLY_ACC=CAM_ASM_000672 /TAXON_ID=267983 /ORGANISM="Skeletonema japonicum, Strain CCMP2506" /LENGTH=709 /DNA_ID=CAMNT_0048234187 /DNA_START=46 /DNA_END=2176 /DNA_ORIENTATION=-